MKTETIYVCDYCGKTFDDYEKCYNHEIKEIEKTLEGVKFFGEDGKRLSFDACPDGIYYFETTAECAEAVDKCFAMWGYCAPSDDVDTACGGQFFWDGNYWVNVEHLRKKLAEIEEVFKGKE